MSGSKGIEKCAQVAILNANYISKKLDPYFKTKFNRDGYVAHECILDCSQFEHLKIKEKDVAKRLMD